MDIEDDAQPFPNEVSITDQWQNDNQMPDGGEQNDEYSNRYRREIETQVANWTTTGPIFNSMPQRVVLASKTSVAVLPYVLYRWHTRSSCAPCGCSDAA